MKTNVKQISNPNKNEWQKSIMKVMKDQNYLTKDRQKIK
jgi:hypothetical protein